MPLPPSRLPQATTRPPPGPPAPQQQTQRHPGAALLPLGPIQFVRQATNGASTAATSGTVTITAPNGGNILVACIALGSATAGAKVNSITSTGATWTNVAQSASNVTGTNRQEIWVGTGDTGTTITINFSASSKWAANISEWSSGLKTTVDVTAVTNTGSVATGTNTTTSTGLSTPGSDLIVAAMNLALSNASTDFSSTSGSPDTNTALTWVGSGATTTNNVGMQAVYDISSDTFINETFSWVTAAAWQYAWAAVSLRAKTRNISLSATLTPTLAPLAYDTFVRANQSGWGTATDGDTWSLGASSGGSGTSVLTIAANEGTYTGTQANENWYLLGSQKQPDGDVLVRFNASNYAGGVGNFEFGLVSRWTDSATYVIAYTNGGNSETCFSTGGTRTLQTGPTLVAGTAYWMRLRCSGTSVQSRIWQDGTTEPSSWDASTFSSLAKGQVGVFIALQATSDTVSIDHFSFTPIARSPVIVGKALAATVTQTPAITKQTARSLAATLTSTANTVKQPVKALAATVTITTASNVAFARAFTVTMTGTASLSRTTARALAATITATTTLAKQPSKILAATLTAAAAIVKQPTKVLEAQLAGAATVARTSIKALAATVAMTTASNISVVRALTAAITTSGTLAKASQRAFDATVTAVGTVAKEALRAVEASLSATAALAREAGKTVAADLTPSATISKETAREYAATIQPTGTISRLTERAFSASVQATANLSRFTARALSATLSGLGALETFFVSGGLTMAFNATLTASASLARSTQRAFTATVPASAILQRVTEHVLAATMSASASVAKETRHLFAATLPVTARVAKTTSRAFAATITASAQLAKTGELFFASTVTASAGLARATRHVFAATLPANARVTKATQRLFAATIPVAARVAKTIPQAFTATMTASASLAKTVQLPFAATITASAGMVRAIQHVLVSTIPLRGTVTKGTRRALGATIPIVAGVQRTTIRALSAVVTMSAGLAKKPVLALTSALAVSAEINRATFRALDAQLNLAANMVGFFRPALRFLRTLPKRVTLSDAALRSHLFALTERSALFAITLRSHLATLLPRPVAFVSGLRAHLFVLAWRSTLFVLGLRAQQFRKKENEMRLVPSGAPGASAEIAPEEANIDFTADFADEIPQGVAIDTFQVTATQLGASDDITDSFITVTHQSGTQVTAIVGNQAQTLHAVYRLRYEVTLNNAPPTTLVGVLDITCKD